MRVVLVEPTHPGNIGSTARAMKNMGFSELCLVNPKHFPDPQATAMSAGAEDILHTAQVVQTFDEAIADCTWVLGTSARTRTIAWPLSTPREIAPELMQRAQHQSVAVVFGRESVGLHNEELAKCHRHLYIPTNPVYSSLNLAQAVQIVVYECALARDDNQVSVALTEEPLAEHQEMDYLYKRLETILTHSGFLNPEKPRHLMPRLQRLLLKAQLTKQELNMLQGALESLFAHQTV